jgi:hypothetical protein
MRIHALHKVASGGVRSIYAKVIGVAEVPRRFVFVFPEGWLQGEKRGDERKDE